MCSTRAVSPNGWLRTSLFLLLWLWVGPLSPAAGQFLVPPCQIEINAGYDAYLNQEYQVAVDLVTGCVEQVGISDAETIQAYRLMSLAYFRQQALVDARSAITRILSIDPTYTADPVEDPPSYALLVSMVRDVLAVDTDSTRMVNAILSTDSSTPPLPVASPDSPLVEDEALASSPSPPASLASFPSEAPLLQHKLLPTNGLRLTLRNQGYELVNGLNLTMWRPRPTTSHGRVSGLALGVPTTGAAHLKGIGIGLIGVTGSNALHGLGVGGIGLTAGEMHGIALGGLGLSVHDHLYGLSATGGLTGGSGSVRGLAVSGLGMNVGGSVGGIQVGGLGVRAGDGIGGLTMGLLGASSGARISGLTVTGGLIHAHDTLAGISATGGAIVAARVQGFAIGSVMVQQSGTGLFLAPLYLNSGRDGPLTGLSLSAVNHVRGRQRGLSIGLINVARELNGVQLGLLNYAGNNPRALRLLPGLNLNL